MTADTAMPTAASGLRRAHQRPATSDRYRLAVGVIVAAQAVWLAVLMSRGWYYQTDFSNLAEATGRPLSPSYLTATQGGHLAVGDRLVYWFLNRAAPLDHPLTVVLRVALQALTTVLLARLLTLLVGRRRGVLVIVALYAISPLLIQSQLWLTAAIAFLPSQVLVLVALDAHVRYALTRRLRWAALAASGIFAAASFSEQSAVAVLAFPLLSFGFLHSGTWLERLRETLRCWPEWAMITAPIAAFLGYFFGSGKYVATTLGLGFGDAVNVVWDELSKAVAPGIAGGPLVWASGGDNYLSLVNPAEWLRFVSALLVAGLVAVGVRRTGWHAIVAWAIPLVVIVVGIVIVAIGRYRGLGDLIALQIEHTGYVVIPVALAVTLSLWPVEPTAVAARVAGTGAAEPGAPVPGGSSPTRRAAAVCVLAVTAASITSAVTYTERWAKNPAQRYVDRMSADLDRLGPRVALYDSPVNPAIIPIVEPRHFVSDLVALVGRHARFDIPDETLLAARPDGSIGPAVLLVTAAAAQDPGPSCALRIIGEGDFRIPFLKSPHSGEYFLRLSYLQAAPSVVSIRVEGADGEQAAPVRGARTPLTARLGSITERLPLLSPAALIVHSESPAANICISNILVGSPVPGTP